MNISPLCDVAQTSDCGIDMDTLITILDHGYDDSEGFDSAEFAL